MRRKMEEAQQAGDEKNQRDRFYSSWCVVSFQEKSFRREPANPTPHPLGKRGNTKGKAQAQDEAKGEGRGEEAEAKKGRGPDYSKQCIFRCPFFAALALQKLCSSRLLCAVMTAHFFINKTSYCLSLCTF